MGNVDESMQYAETIIECSDIIVEIIKEKDEDEDEIDFQIIVEDDL